MEKEVHSYKVEVDCSSCISSIELVFKKYPDISWKLNIVRQTLKVSCNFDKYSDEFIVKLLKKAGYDAEKI